MLFKLSYFVGPLAVCTAGLAAAQGPNLTSDTNGVPTLTIINAAFTSKWNFLTLTDALNVTASSTDFDLIKSGTLVRLAPGQAAVVQVGVKNKPGVAAGSTCNATITATWGAKLGVVQTTSSTISGECGFGDYTADASSITWHTSPDWYNDVKFGIFIHWGVYSAPAYGSVAPYESYAEWYWHTMHNPNDHTQTYQYHEATYGTSFNYDDFISNFTASKFDAKVWVDLVAAAGAQYIVPVTKHHDGFALFDFPSSISNRSSVQYGPKRDFINEILTAAKTYQPHIRRGTYFSLPEWYNPAYTTYAMGSFPGGPPINPYTGETLTYTGYVPVGDFVQDIQLPQQNILAYSYDTELMWCDIGGANNATIFASKWLNWARDQGRQVTFNDRCGLVGDFDTPEYATNSGTVVRKWESTRGMDPFSFGYNYKTPDSQYLTANGIVQALVDIVSKNGNFLLDIGPRNDGTIADVMVQGLTEAGYWINAHSESIFKTRYWSVTPGLGSFRYTTTQDAFYIHYLTTPGTTLEIPDRVPYLPGDTVTVVGGSMHGSPVTVTERGDGMISLGLSSAQITADQYVWTFKLAYTTTNAYSIIQADDYSSNNGTQTQTTSDIGGGENVGWIHDGNWLAYSNVDFGTIGAKGILSRISSGAGSSVNGTVAVVLDSLTAAPIGSFSVTDTGGWQSWTNISTSVSAVTGLHTVYLAFSSDQSADFVNINWFTFF